MNTRPQYIAATTASVTMPVSTDGFHAAGRHLIGIGLFIARRDNDSRWRFACHASAIQAGEPECALLHWTSVHLPRDGTMIGWNVDQALVPSLLDAAVTAPPLLAHRFIKQFHSLLSGGVADMAVGHGGAGATALATVATDMAIHAPTWNDDAITGAWAIGAVDDLRRDLADEALAIWRIFIRTAGAVGLDAEAATDAWLFRRQRINAVARTGSAA